MNTTMRILQHDTALGNAAASDLFQLVDIRKKDDVAVPRQFADYQVNIDTDRLPQGVNII
ncbi:MAG: hypothetical protein GX638_18455 [Crenarchaeota archaeon]|nr:hypothetical protein [Thermoproteota archaeon]